MSERIAGLIQRNVNLWYADVISFERFNQRQEILWLIARVRKVDEEVLEIVKPPLVTLAGSGH